MDNEIRVKIDELNFNARLISVDVINGDCGLCDIEIHIINFCEDINTPTLRDNKILYSSSNDKNSAIEFIENVAMELPVRYFKG